MFLMFSSVNVPDDTFGRVASIENIIVERLVPIRASAGITKLGFSENFLNSTVNTMDSMIEFTEIMILALLSAIPLKVR